MRLLLLPFCAVGLTACASYTDPERPATPPAISDGGTCDASPAQYHVGHDATAEMGTAILNESGARTLRWGPPNTAWTMDYREDRVNVRYDEKMKITEVSCG
uniref:I78 family peptidase inhibitor n=1 Tax=uncultured Altererythrobacter sp. TaxID=500840 RepID=UPI002618A7C3|nr:I78 family peptidase inhibitor [uncultured Altererythrobacter sp.]